MISTLPLSGQQKIVGEDVDPSGITSAYISHHFSLSPGNNIITDSQWTFNMVLDNDQYQTITTANTQDFTTPAVQDATNFKHTDDGCLLGEILFSGSLDGEPVNLKYQLLLSLKPVIISLECISITPSTSNPQNYDITIEVKYEGSEWLTASVREKGTSIAYTYHANSPHDANMVLSDIRLWDETYVTVSATNQYGTGEKVIIIPAREDPNSELVDGVREAQDDTYSIAINGNNIAVDMQGQTAKTIELYSAAGALVAQRQRENSISTNGLPHGIYVLVITDDKNKKLTRKLRL